jgi:hypothetical protein
MMETVRVKFLRGTSLGGKDAAIGDVIDLDRRLFAQFAQQGRVVVVSSADAALVAEAAEDPKPRIKRGK